MTQYDLEGKILFLRRFVAEIAREFSIPSPSLERLYCEKRDRVVLIRRTAFSAKTETAVDFIYLFSWKSNSWWYMCGCFSVQR